MSKPNKLGHYFSGKTCIECGMTRREAARHGGRCTGPQEDEELDLEEEDGDGDYYVLARPLVIVPVGDPGDEELGAHLVSADDHTLVAVHIVEPADTFDPDGAFRVLDDLRARSEMVLGWVKESLAVSPAPRAAKRRLPAWTAPWLATGALAVPVLLAPASFILEVGPRYYGILTLLIAARLGYGALRQPHHAPLPPGCLAALAVPVVSFVVALISVATMSEATNVAAFRLLLIAGGAFLFYKAYDWQRNRTAERDAPRRPTEHPSADHEEGAHEPAVHYRPELILMDRDLHVAIECCAEDGRVLRLLTLAVDTATREYADEMVRMARARDDELTRLRDAEREKEAASAAALQRLDELERSRRSLPE